MELLAQSFSPCHDLACSSSPFPRGLPPLASRQRSFNLPLSQPFSFVDQSHVQFYGTFLCAKKDKKSQGNGKLTTSLNAVNCERLVTPLGVSGICEPVLIDVDKCREELQMVEQDLMKELADLKAQMKQKKKQLKAHKKALKAQKQEKTKVKGCSSSSSSSSESSDCDCESIDMKLLRENRDEPKDAAPIIAPVSQDVPTCRPPSANLSAQNLNALRIPAGEDELSILAPTANLSQEKAKIGAKIEVCVGGKCKRAGSERLLASLQGQIPCDSSVAAAPCKCMGKCGMAINVRVQKEETNPQHHSHVGVGDAGVLLRHHFGLGPPPTGFPSFGLESTGMPCISAPQHAVASV